MTILYIEEYQNLATDDKGNVIGPGNLITTQKITVAASSAASSAFNSKTNYLLIESDTPCQFEIATAPTADGDSQYLSANNRKLVPVPQSGNQEEQKIAVIEKQ